MAVAHSTTGTTTLDDLADCDLVIEAVVEDLAVKKELFAALDDVLKPGAVLATTTSSLPVIECAQVTGRPADVVGMHWFNPATVMRLVEVVPTVVGPPLGPRDDVRRAGGQLLVAAGAAVRPGAGRPGDRPHHVAVLDPLPRRDTGALLVGVLQRVQRLGAAGRATRAARP